MPGASGYNNYTIVRPATTYSKMRFQLVTLEAGNAVGRARKGGKVVLPKRAYDKPSTFCWGGNVSQMIARLLFHEETLGQAYNVCSSESHTWGEIAQYYRGICGLESVWVDKEDYLKILRPTVTNGVRWQLEYTRLFRRITDNSKVLAATGMKQSDMKPLYEGLKEIIASIPEDYVFAETEIDLRMDAYLKESGL